MGEMGMQAKVGALVLFSLALLVGFIFILGDVSFSEGFEFSVEFENAGGLKPGADVAIAGLNIGNVSSLDFIENKDATGGGMNAVAVSATLTIEEEYATAVREDSEFFISTRGVLGEPYIEIVTASYEGAAIQRGERLRGVDPPRMDMLVSRAMRLLSALTDLLEDPEVTTRDLIANASILMRTLQEILSGNRATIDSLFGKADSAIGRADALLGSLNVALEDGQGVQGMIRDLKVASADLRTYGALREAPDLGP